MKRTIVAAVLAALLAVPARAEQEAYTADDTLAAISTVDPRIRGWVYSIVGCETGWTFNPYAVGDRGESLGAVQLHRRGLRPLFYRMGYTNPYDPYQAVAFLEWAIGAGLARHWSCA